MLSRFSVEPYSEHPSSNMEWPFPREIWILLAKQPLTKLTLRNLWLTSKILKDIFTPPLYRNINLSSRDSYPRGKLELLSALDIGSHLRYTQFFEAGYVSPKIELAFLSKCLEKMTNLVSCQLKYASSVFQSSVYIADSYKASHSLRIIPLCMKSAISTS